MEREGGSKGAGSACRRATAMPVSLAPLSFFGARARAPPRGSMLPLSLSLCVVRASNQQRTLGLLTSLGSLEPGGEAKTNRRLGLVGLAVYSLSLLQERRLGKNNAHLLHTHTTKSVLGVLFWCFIDYKKKGGL